MNTLDRSYGKARLSYLEWLFNAKSSIYIYIYIYTHTHTHIYIYTNFVEHNRHFLSTYFLVDPFISPYWFYSIRQELIDVFSIIVYIPSTFCLTLGHHQGRIYYKSDINFCCIVGSVKVFHRYKPKSWQVYQRAINAFFPWCSQTPSIYIFTGVILKRVTECIVPV